MTNQDDDPYRTRTDVSAQDLRIIDKLATAFDQGWQKGQQPQIEAYLTESPAALRGDVFQSLLRIELGVRTKLGTSLPAGTYLARFPQYAKVISAIYEETVRPSRSSTEVSSEAWYYLRNNVRVGPFTFEQLKQIVRAGDLRPKDRVASGATSDWGEAGSIPDLFPRPGESGGLKAPAPGDGIKGDYVLLERVGRGGMGDVFKAYRFSLSQEVALKIIRHDRFVKLSAHKQNEILEAFRKEMQVAASLKHDNIITIFDNGDHNGLPFYTMNFVEKSLANILHHGPLSGQKAAEYIHKVALAVDYANDKGIVHRDIKPANILLDKQKALLSDLGLATTENLLEGQGGQIAGTPPFMAPEQVRGDKPDKRTDVYGLGATLYCLLTGKPPHQGKDWEQIRDQVLKAEPLSPRKLNPAVDRNLEAITLKCLEKDPDKRYKSAGDLADDLDCYLNDRPVSAKIPYIWERLFKWARREPIKAGLVAGIAFLLVTFVGCESWSNIRLSSALETAQLQRQSAESAREVAQQERDRAEGLFKTAAAERGKAVELGAIAQKEQVRAETLAKELALQRDQVEEARQKARDTATLLGKRVLRKYESQQRPQNLDDLLKEATFSEAQLKKNPSDEIKLDLAAMYQDLSNLVLKDGQRKPAAAYLARCIALQLELVEKYPVLKVELSFNLLDLGNLYGQLGDPLQEIQSDTKALELLEELRKQGYQEPVVLSAIGQAHVALGIDYRKKQDRKKAHQHQQEAVLILEQLTAGEDGSAGLFDYKLELGRAYYELGLSFGGGAITEAPAAFEKAIQIFAKKTQYRRNLARANLGLGNAWLDLREKEKALVPLQEALALSLQILKELPNKGAQFESARGLEAECLSSQGKAYHLKPDPDAKKAEQLFQQSLEIRKELAAKEGNEAVLVNGLIDWAKFHEKENNFREAIDAYDQAILYQEKYIQQAKQDFARHRVAGVIYFNKAIFLHNNKKDKEAVPSLLKAKDHEKLALELGGGEGYRDYLLQTHKALFVVQLNSKLYKEAADTIEERVTYWPKDAEKYAEAARDFGKLQQLDKSDEFAQRLVTFLDKGLQQKLLRIELIVEERAFVDLRSHPEYKKLIKKYQP